MAPRWWDNGSADDNCESTTAIDYNLSDIVQQFQRDSLKTPCVLCGTIHPGRIHNYVYRNYRDREILESIRIIIPVIICMLAQKLGIQYTKRLLPDFLTPWSIIRLDYLLEAAALPLKERTTDRVCELLGCVDPRVARRRLSDLNDAIRGVSLDLAYRRSTTPELGPLPTSTPDTATLARLSVLYQAEQDAQQRAGRDTAPLPSLRQLVQAAMWKQPGKNPSSCVSHPSYPP